MNSAETKDFKPAWYPSLEDKYWALADDILRWVGGQNGQS